MRMYEVTKITTLDPSQCTWLNYAWRWCDAFVNTPEGQRAIDTEGYRILVCMQLVERMARHEKVLFPNEQLKDSTLWLFANIDRVWFDDVYNSHTCNSPIHSAIPNPHTTRKSESIQYWEFQEEIDWDLVEKAYCSKIKQDSRQADIDRFNYRDYLYYLFLCTQRNYKQLTKLGFTPNKTRGRQIIKEVCKESEEFWVEEQYDEETKIMYNHHYDDFVPYPKYLHDSCTYSVPMRKLADYETGCNFYDTVEVIYPLRVAVWRKCYEEKIFFVDDETYSTPMGKFSGFTAILKMREDWEHTSDIPYEQLNEQLKTMPKKAATVPLALGHIFSNHIERNPDKYPGIELCEYFGGWVKLLINILGYAAIITYLLFMWITGEQMVPMGWFWALVAVVLCTTVSRFYDVFQTDEYVVKYKEIKEMVDRLNEIRDMQEPYRI